MYYPMTFRGASMAFWGARRRRYVDSSVVNERIDLAHPV